MCCCMVLWVLLIHNTIQQHILLKCVVVGTRNNTHNTIQQHIWLKCVVVGTRNNTHNTIQQHILLKCVVVGTRNNTHNTIQQHIWLKCVVVGTRNNTHNTIQQHTLLMLLLCVTYEPSQFSDEPLYQFSPYGQSLDIFDMVNVQYNNEIMVNVQQNNVIIVNLAKGGYCNAGVCLSVCVSASLYNTVTSLYVDRLLQYLIWRQLGMIHALLRNITGIGQM